MQSRFRLWIYASALIAVAACGASAWAAEPVPTSPKIIGGEPVPAGESTYQVALLRADVTDNFSAQFCGGTLIDRSWVVTAAHCVQGETPLRIHVLVGTNKLDGSGVRLPVNSITVHPKYCGQRCHNDYDVAMLHLGSPASRELQIARLMGLGEEGQLAEPGDLGLVTGWGNMSTSGSDFPDTLEGVKVPFVARAECNSEQSYDGVISSRMLCAGLPEGGKDSCQGDSGGPLVVRRVQDGRPVWLLAGIVSWGEGCARPNLYGVYSRVSVLRPWIVRVIDRAPY